MMYIVFILLDKLGIFIKMIVVVSLLYKKKGDSSLINKVENLVCFKVIYVLYM